MQCILYVQLWLPGQLCIISTAMLVSRSVCQVTNASHLHPNLTAVKWGPCNMTCMNVPRSTVLSVSGLRIGLGGITTRDEDVLVL